MWALTAELSALTITALPHCSASSCPLAQIHWFSIINSFVTVLLLTGFLATILMRVLKADFVKYSRDDGRVAEGAGAHCFGGGESGGAVRGYKGRALPPGWRGSLSGMLCKLPECILRKQRAA